MLNQTLCAQAQAAYEAAVNSPCPDWRAVAELFRAAMQAERVKRAAKPKAIGGRTRGLQRRSRQASMPVPTNCRSVYGRGGGVHACTIGSRQAAQYRPRIARCHCDVPLAQGRAAAGRLPRIRSGDPRARNLSSALPGNGRIIRRGRLQQAHGYGTPEQRSRARGRDAGTSEQATLFVKGLLYEQSSAARAKHMAKSHLKLVTPATVNRTVTPKRLPNADLRTREYLTEAEVERLMAAAKGNRWGHRDATMILVAYRHGLRASEAGGPALGSGGVRDGHPARPQGQAGHAKHPSDPRGRTAGAAAASARAGAQVALRVHLGAGGAVQHRWLRPHGRAGRRSRPSLGSRRTRTCCGTPAATRWPTRGTTRAPCKPISATATSSTPCATLNCRRRGSRISGGTDRRQPVKFRSARLQRPRC